MSALTGIRRGARDFWRALFRTTPAYDSPQAHRNAEALRTIAEMIPPDVYRLHGGSAGEIHLAAILSNVRSVATGRTPSEAAELPAQDQIIETMERLLAMTGWRRIEALSRTGGRAIQGYCVDDNDRAWNWRADSDGTNTLIRQQPWT